MLAAHPGLSGLNVTTPHKQAVIPFLDDLDAAATAIGAVNCIRISDGKRRGFNTDWTGFRDSLVPLLPQSASLEALVLGTGGAALAVCYALNALGIAFKAVSRNAKNGVLAYGQVTPAIIARHRLIINATTLGTGGTGLPPLPYEALTPAHILYDLVYNPPQTPFLAEGAARGAITKNGGEMLLLQAEAAWAIWQTFP